MNLRALVLQAIGFGLATFFLVRLPDAAFGQAQTFLLVFGALLLLLVAVAIVVRPVRLALFRFYGVRHAEAGPATADPEEMRLLLPALVPALVALAAAGVAALLRTG